MPTGIYKRIKISPEKLFLKKVDRKGGNFCWNWTGYKNKNGYGSFVALGESLAHRFSYRLYKGEIPQGMLVCHTCDNPSCVNPFHLWVGTAQDNLNDCIKKGRDRHDNIVKGEQNGRSKLKEKQVKEIKRLMNKFSQQELANRFRCHQSTIHYILSGKTWNHVKA